MLTMITFIILTNMKTASFLLLTEVWSNATGIFRVKGRKKMRGLKRSRTDQTVIKLNHYLKPFLSQKVKRKRAGTSG